MSKTKSKNYWECHNITREIGTYADKLGLECMATGGNCDFIVKSLHENNELIAVLSSADSGECPDKLNELAYVSIKLDSEWCKSVDIKFDTARKAMQFMASLTEVSSCNVGDLVAQ